MPAEAAFSFNARNQAGEQITLRGDTWGEFSQSVREMFDGDPDATDEFLARFVATAKARQAVTEKQAVENIKNARPGSTVVGNEPAAGEIRMIDGVQKKWIPAGVSKAGKAYKGFWG